MEVLEFGHQLMWIAAGLLTMMVALTLICLAFRSRRFVVCVRLAFLPLLLLIAGADRRPTSAVGARDDGAQLSLSQLGQHGLRGDKFQRAFGRRAGPLLVPPIRRL